MLKGENPKPPLLKAWSMRRCQETGGPALQGFIPRSSARVGAWQLHSHVRTNLQKKSSNTAGVQMRYNSET